MHHHAKHFSIHCTIQGILHGGFISWWASTIKSNLSGIDLLQWGIDNLHLMSEEITTQEFTFALLALVPGVILAWKFDLINPEK